MDSNPMWEERRSRRIDRYMPSAYEEAEISNDLVGRYPDLPEPVLRIMLGWECRVWAECAAREEQHAKLVEEPGDDEGISDDIFIAADLGDPYANHFDWDWQCVDPSEWPESFRRSVELWEASAPTKRFIPPMGGVPP